MAEGVAQWWVGLEPVGGVFEGGGAKGVAYAGALSALERRGYWFEAVAGASAGALTATLIAAGMRPDTLQEVSLDGLARMDPAGKNGSRGKRNRLARALWNLSKHAYGLDEGPLREWLLQRLNDQMKRFGVEADRRGPTFEQLQRATGIDLYVVAANVSLQEQIVFHHETTPDCQVLDAVIASCAIPGAFQPGHLAVPDSTGDLFLHTVVDGGVWSNFPISVLTDQRFRDHVGLVNSPPPKVVLGFILDEPASEGVLTSERYQQAEFTLYESPFWLETRYFREWHDALAEENPELEGQLDKQRRVMAEPAIPLEWRGELDQQVSRPLTQYRKLSLEEYRSAPREDLERALEEERSTFGERFGFSVFAGHRLRGFWPKPKGRRTIWLAHHADRHLGYLSDWRVALVVWSSVLAGWLTISYVILTGVWGLLDGDANSLLFAVTVLLLAVTFVVAGVPVLYALLVLLVLNVVALATVRRIGFSLPRTYAAGPGAPTWLGGQGDAVIRLPIPEDLTTLAFDVDAGVVADACGLADNATIAKLDELEATGVLNRGSPGNRRDSYKTPSDGIDSTQPGSRPTDRA